MKELLCWFWLYSFLGYGLEKLFAAAVGSPHQVRRCFTVLPLCPVYGLGMLAVLALPEGILNSLWLPLFGAVVTTAVEYAVHWGYERFLGVAFWDYSGVSGNLRGRVCLPFALIWGVPTAAAVWWVQPWAARLAAAVSPAAVYAALFPFAADAVLSIYVLRATGDIDALSYTTWKR